MRIAAPFTPGVYPDMPDATYRAIDALSNSTLKRFAEAPAKAHVSRPDSAALSTGRLLHAAVLEAHTFDQRYAVTDLDRRGTKAWQEEEAAAIQSGRELIKRADYDMAQRVRDAVLAHPTARDLLRPGLETEVSVLSVDEETGLNCRSRMDGIRSAERLIIDVKTTMDASPGEFGRSAAKFLYHWQHVFYRDRMASAPDGFVPEAFYFIAVEKDAPHLVAVYELPPGAVMVAEQQVREAMQEYAECKAANAWPGYPEGVLTLDLPAWALSEGTAE